LLRAWDDQDQRQGRLYGMLACRSQINVSLVAAQLTHDFYNTAATSFVTTDDRFFVFERFLFVDWLTAGLITGDIAAA
jgi:hypothetical protein